MTRLLSLAALAVAIGLITSTPVSAQTKKPKTKTVADMITSSKDHTILLGLLKDAGLADTLKGTGPFTVFAPTDAAFKKLGEAELKKLKGDKALLKKTLLAHVVTGKAISTKDASTTTGKDIHGFKFTSKDDDSKVGPANVTISDIQASNGVLHVLDAVLIPGS